MAPRKPARQTGVRGPHQQPTRSLPGESEHSGLLSMQRMVGNAATRRAVEEPLDPSVRAGLARRFGAELIHVRVHRPRGVLADVAVGAVPQTLQRQPGSRDKAGWLTGFRAERDPGRLADMLRPRTDSELSRLSQTGGGDQLHTDVVIWERAWRARKYVRLSSLTDGADPRLRTAYGRRVLTAIMNGALSIRITGKDTMFRSFVEGAFADLTTTPRGLRLILDLLATGQKVSLAPAAAGTGHNTVPTDISRARLSTQVTDEHAPNVGDPLPPKQQRPGHGTGSKIQLDISTMGNEVTLGGTAAQPVIIDANSTASVGHELIHALHNARGINIGTGGPRETSGLADPVTGEPESPEELYTMTGQTRFTPVRHPSAADLLRPRLPTQYNVPGTITENDLRADLGLPARSAHFGALGTIGVPHGASVTVEALIARYRLPSGAVPPAGAAVIRTMLAAVHLTDEALAWIPADFRIRVPHPDHVLMRIRFVDRNTALADRMTGLTVQ
ncbi:MAG: hypothetical protein ACRDTD_02965 [Pseudonocardiaceae bacterium]